MINGEPEDFMPSNFWFVDEYDLTKRFSGNADMIVANSIIASCLNIAPYERCTYSSLIRQIENFIAGGNMTPEEERIFVEKKIGHKLSFNIDKRHIGRGNPLLATGRIVTDDEIERQAQKIR